ncbi:3-hydroxyacyl-CoA dehydrogenase family protein [Albibacterium indicum]|uniref:3-hydroxyacyl-CoA dehydrogenase family protein n=1 Tax=Albibacterium indicum TaxID=2292082 RepID=UPI000E547FA3|nr:3-hydroxybutyryl-CoA dehydrogenase [Pedobacter indicus]
MKQIIIIGAGTMGNGIAHSFALHNFQVSLVDTNPDSLNNALQTIDQNLSRKVKKELIQPLQKVQALSNIKLSSSLKESLKEADLVIEAITENLEAKRSLFREIDQFCPSHTILASNTSSISITTLASVTKRPKQVIGMHFMNPVPVMKLVEVIRGYETSDATVSQIMSIARKLDKTPVEVNDFPGFIANRILMPMINEAIYAFYEGVAGKEEIDEVMKLGMAHPMGPLQLADFIGLDVCLAILRVLYDGFGNPKYAPCPLLTKMVTAGKLGRKTNEGFYVYDKA